MCVCVCVKTIYSKDVFIYIWIISQRFMFRFSFKPCSGRYYHVLLSHPRKYVQIKKNETKNGKNLFFFYTTDMDVIF